MKTFLVFVKGTHESGESLDLFVEVNHADQAIFLWREYFDLSESYFPEKLLAIPSLDGTVRAIDWRDFEVI